MKLAVDAMGGDHAPGAVVEGVLAVAKEYADLHILLVGQEEQIRACLPPGAELSRIDIIPAADIIKSDDEPVRAVRRKKDSSLVVAAELVKSGRADGLLSAGNTGALMAAGLLIVGRMEEIERPALASVWPCLNGKSVLVLDVGANMDATSENLAQYAVMGSIYSRIVMGLPSPRVGLLNIGTEDNKGNHLTKETFPLLAAREDLNFIGNIEARDVLQGVCDVLVCDGFAGNNLLKGVEGTVLGMFGELRQVFTSSLLTKLAALALKPALRKFRDRYDYREQGGAPLLGLKGAVIKAHGSSNARAIQTAIRQAYKYMEGNAIAEITRSTRGD
ncbi:MAG: phosphate acyltransferase [Bacilli bacterium]|nr:phosphate acyltransferase [Bacilli bacterium]